MSSSTEIPMHSAMYLVVNLASVAIKSFNFSTIFGKVAVLDGVHEVHLLLNPHHFKISYTTV
jgi:hypothetical protein